MSRSIVSLFVLGVVGLPGVSAPASAQTSTFDSGNEGWTGSDLRLPIYVNPPIIASNFVVTYNAVGGNAGGFIGHTDGPNDPWFWFAAPAAYTGNRSAMYGGTLSFDLMTTASDGVTYPDLLLVGGGHSLFHTGDPPSATWSSRSIVLSPSAAWAHHDGTAVTAAEFQATMASLQSLYINGDWFTGVETTGLDNVILVPGPSAGGCLLLAGGLVATRRRRG